MLKWLMRIILTLVVLIGFGGLCVLYFITLGTVSPEPEITEIESVFSKNTSVDLEKEKLLREQITVKKAAVKNQSYLLLNQERLLQAKKEELENSINKELTDITARYQAAFDKIKEEYTNDYVEFEKKKEQEYHEKVLVKKELYEKRLTDFIKQFEEEKIEDLELYREELVKRDSNKILNYKLKIDILDLDEKEKEDYEQKLKELEKKQVEELKNKEANLLEEMDKKTKELQDSINQEYLKYQQELEKKIRIQLEIRMKANEDELKEEISEQQRLLNKELEKRRIALQERGQGDISRLENLIKEVREDYLRLQSELTMLEKKVV